VWVLILDRLLADLQDACAAFPDKRTGDVVYSMTDVGMSAFSLFFMQSESFLADQRSLDDERKTSNCHTLFGMARIPTDATIRSLLDPVHPRHLQGCFDQALAIMRERGGMKAFERLGGRALIVFAGTEFFCSQKLGCAHCQTRKRSNGKTDYCHSTGSRNAIRSGSLCGGWPARARHTSANRRSTKSQSISPASFTSACSPSTMSSRWGPNLSS
jgi:hypothetical protein